MRDQDREKQMEALGPRPEAGARAAGDNNVAERRDIAGPLAGATLTSANIGGLDYDPVELMPDVKVLKIGGQSMLDRGRSAIFPLLDELVPLKDKYQLLLCCGGGPRARHI
jgi:molybdenum storage protein